MTLDDVEVTEETTYIPASEKKPPLAGRQTPLRPSSAKSMESTPSSVSRQRRRLTSDSSRHELASEETGTMTLLPGGVTAKHEAVAAEQLTTAEVEEQQRIVIKAICDPRPTSQWNASGELGPGRLTMEVCRCVTVVYFGSANVGLHAADLSSFILFFPLT